MKYGWMVLLSAIALVSLAFAAQKPAPTAGSADDSVTLGRRLFQQNCSICHTQATLTNPMYGPSLYSELVNGKETAVRAVISNGSSKMPGFRYSLKASEIDAIVAYLKTVNKPAQRGPQKGEGPVD